MTTYGCGLRWCTTFFCCCINFLDTTASPLQLSLKSPSSSRVFHRRSACAAVCNVLPWTLARTLCARLLHLHVTSCFVPVDHDRQRPCQTWSDLGRAQRGLSLIFLLFLFHVRAPYPSSMMHYDTVTSWVLQYWRCLLHQYVYTCTHARLSHARLSITTASFFCFFFIRQQHHAAATAAAAASNTQTDSTPPPPAARGDPKLSPTTLRCPISDKPKNKSTTDRKSSRLACCPHTTPCAKSAINCSSFLSS